MAALLTASGASFAAIRSHYATFGDRLPVALSGQLDSLFSRLADNR